MKKTTKSRCELIDENIKAKKKELSWGWYGYAVWFFFGIVLMTFLIIGFYLMVRGL